MEKSIIVIAVVKVFWMTEVKARVVGSRVLAFGQLAALANWRTSEGDTQREGVRQGLKECLSTMSPYYPDFWRVRPSSPLLSIHILVLK